MLKYVRNLHSRDRVQSVASGAPVTGHRRALPNAWRATIAFVLSLFSPIEVAAQLVRGIVQDAVTGTPVDAADILLVASSDSVIGRTITDVGGRFEVRAPLTGSYRLRVARLGYESYTTSKFAIVVGRDTALDLRLEPSPDSLAPLEVEAQDARLRGVGFYERLGRGIGYFRTPQDMKELQPMFPEDLFRGLPGVRVLTGGAVVTMSRSKRCRHTVAVDGTVLVSNWSEIIHVSDIHAIEVYTRPTGLPPWLAGSVSECGAIVIWTK